MLGMPMPFNMPGMQSRPMTTPFPQPIGQPQAMFNPQPTQWQTPPQGKPYMPSPAGLASGATPPRPLIVRGVSQDPAPAPTVKKFVMPSPEELGVATTMSLTRQPAASAPIDWNALHARMERLGVLKYEKAPIPAGGVRVVLLLPTSDPTLAQPVEAVAESEASALVAALQRGEAWMRQR